VEIKCWILTEQFSRVYTGSEFLPFSPLSIILQLFIIYDEYGVHLYKEKNAFREEMQFYWLRQDRGGSQVKFGIDEQLRKNGSRYACYAIW